MHRTNASRTYSACWYTPPPWAAALGPPIDAVYCPPIPTTCAPHRRCSGYWAHSPSTEGRRSWHRVCSSLPSDSDGDSVSYQRGDDDADEGLGEIEGDGDLLLPPTRHCHSPSAPPHCHCPLPRSCWTPRWSSLPGHSENQSVGSPNLFRLQWKNIILSHKISFAFKSDLLACFLRALISAKWTKQRNFINIYSFFYINQYSNERA